MLDTSNRGGGGTVRKLIIQSEFDHTHTHMQAHAHIPIRTVFRPGSHGDSCRFDCCTVRYAHPRRGACIADANTILFLVIVILIVVVVVIVIVIVIILIDFKRRGQWQQ